MQKNYLKDKSLQEQSSFFYGKNLPFTGGNDNMIADKNGQIIYEWTLFERKVQ